MVKRLLVAALSLIVVTSATPASAHTQTHWDPNDTGGPLDLTYVGFYDGHGDDNWSRPVRIWLCVQTQRQWATRVLNRAGGFRFYLDVRGDSTFDYDVAFKNSSGNLRGTVRNLHKQVFVGSFPGYRFGEKRGGCVLFKKRHIAPIQQVVRWQVFSSYQTRRICRSGCIDATRMRKHFM